MEIQPPSLYYDINYDIIMRKWPRLLWFMVMSFPFTLLVNFVIGIDKCFVLVGVPALEDEDWDVTGEVLCMRVDFTLYLPTPGTEFLVFLVYRLRAQNPKLAAL